MTIDRYLVNRKRRFLFFTLFLWIFLINLIPVSVNPNGVIITVPDDYTSIGEAIDNASEGDTIFVKSGVYQENMAYNEALSIHKGLTLIGEDPLTTIIDAHGKYWGIFIYAEDVNVTGFTVFNASIAGVVAWKGSTISNCIIHDCDTNGLQISDVKKFHEKSGISIDNCTIYNVDKGLKSRFSDNFTVLNCVMFNSTIGLEVTYSSDFLLEGCRVHDCNADGISLYVTSNSTIRDCQSHDNSDDGIYLGSSKNIKISNCEFNNNTGEGFYTWMGNHIKVEDTNAQGNTGTGFYFWYTDHPHQENCTSISNSNGVIFNTLEGGVIEGCEVTGNLVTGIILTYTSNINIVNCTVQGNVNSYGMKVDHSNSVTICNTLSYNNYHGMYLNYVDDLYSSNSFYGNNTHDGIYSDISHGQILQCNITDNEDDGLQYVKSEFNLTWCNIEGNKDYGMDDNGNPNRVDGAYCWWGDPSGPYHSISNPSGTGEKVDFLNFKPWLNETHQYQPLLADLRCGLSTKPWRIIYPDRETPKPLDCGAAMVSDWLASAFITTKLTSFMEGVDTDSSFVNPVVKYAEADTTPQADRAPVRFHDEGGIFHFQYKNGTNIPGAELPLSVINNEEDMFVIEVFTDGEGRLMMICYGFGWQGTYAAGKYLENIVFPELNSFPYGWIIVHWEDSNLDGFVNNPGEGDSYTRIANGY
jgi:parallel beta-helix repeat protein